MNARDRLVDDYLARLESELAGVPRARRREVLDGIETHIEESLADVAPDDEVAVRNVLERLGEPAEIAAVARERVDVRPRATWREICALILLPFGGLVLPVVGWFAGVVLLWVSDAWTARDKLIGTLVLPGGLLVPFLLFQFVTSGSGSGTSVWPSVLLWSLLLAPLVADGYLLWRLRASRGRATELTAA
jgi:hypothetical protein